VNGIVDAHFTGRSQMSLTQVGILFGGLEIAEIAIQLKHKTYYVAHKSRDMDNVDI
jgi:hypothetical protein